METLAVPPAAVEARLLRPIVFEQPDLVTDSAWLEHIPFAFWLVEAVRPHRFVELGTHTGASYCAFLQAAESVGSPLSATAVDTWSGDAHTGAYDAAVHEALDAYHARRYPSGSTLLRRSFDAALACFAEGSIDLLHIDGLHTYAAVRHDYEAWRPKMSARGIVVFHDIAERRDDFGVWRLWEELAGSGPRFAFEHGHGLGLIAVGSEPPEPLVWLAGRPPDAAGLIRSFFAAVGANHSARLRERQLRDHQAGTRDLLEQATRTLDSERTAWDREHRSARETIEKGALIIDEQAAVIGEQARILADQARILADQGAWIREHEARGTA